GRFKFFLLIILFFNPFVFAQQIIDQYLILEIPHADRWSFVQVDPLEQALVDGNFQLPSPGQEVKFGQRGQSVWQKITTDSSGWYRPKDKRAFYALFTINAEKEKTIILDGRGHNLVYVNGQPRVGNPYQSHDQNSPHRPKFGLSALPVQLKKGQNTFLFKCYRGRLKVVIHAPSADLAFNVNDVTLPDLISGQRTDAPAAVVVLNNTANPLKDVTISSDNPLIPETKVPIIQPFSARKVPFFIKGRAPQEKGNLPVTLYLNWKGKRVAQAKINLRVVGTEDVQKHTFISHIDGSVQYFAINPAQMHDGSPLALVLSVHGAGVEALNLAQAYFPKKWTHIVAATNRRPFGYNWEDWGRLDALEVLNTVKQKWNIDPTRIYLTGHSMGGHGTWQLGAHYPDQFGAIGPNAGWISYFTYVKPESSDQTGPVEKMLLRANAPSRTPLLAENYKQLGVYIIHGDSDRVVPVQESRKMVEILKKTGHRDFVYHEEPGAGHWWDRSDEPGADCVDWPSLFDFFARHARPTPEQIRQIQFVTASPGISATNRWVTIYAQQRAFEFSKIDIQVDPGNRKFRGKTKNIARLKIDLSPLTPGQPVTVELDGQILKDLTWPAKGALFFEKIDNRWLKTSEWPGQDKGPHRYGGFKDAFRNRVLFVVGSKGSKEENAWALAKARYDAECFWYQGNGSVDIILDREFDPEKYQDRNVILYGNARTNGAWHTLLKDCPIQILEGEIKFGSETLKGNDLAALFVFPRRDSDFASVGVVGGTGINGMRATNTQKYLYAGNGYPDFMVFQSAIYDGGLAAIKAIGYFSNQWKLDKANMGRQ
ncbi:carboxylesterase family protein, partial [Caldithrix abyssi]